MIGIIVEPRFADFLRQRINTLIGIKYDHVFPGAELQSLEQKDLEIISRNDYLVSRMGSGQRSLLFITKEGGFLYNKHDQFFYNQMTFPGKNHTFHVDTIIDGELYIEKQLFLAFDLIVIDGVSIVERSVSTRLGVFMI
jgi:hypothetical protein